MNGAKYPRDWEIISENLKRIRVFGGWLVSNSTIVLVPGKNPVVTESLQYMPDEFANWHLEDK